MWSMSAAVCSVVMKQGKFSSRVNALGAQVVVEEAGEAEVGREAEVEEAGEAFDVGGDGVLLKQRIDAGDEVCGAGGEAFLECRALDLRC